MEEKKTKKKRKILVGYLIISAGIYLYKMPIKSIKIEGNTYLKDNYLTNYLDIDGKSIFKVSSKSIKNKLKSLDLISDVKVHKNILGKLTITVEEEKALFYNYNNKKIVLSNGKEVDYQESYLGIPILINMVPDKVYTEFVKKLNDVDKDVLSLVSVIEYSPYVVSGKTVDDKRFLLRMNDGNNVYINTINIKKFNDYLSMLEGYLNNKGNVKGCLYLDSNLETSVFEECEMPDVTEGDNDAE